MDSTTRPLQLRQEVAKTYADLAPVLVTYARSLGLDEVGAEDVVQKCFLAVLDRSFWPTEPRPYFFRAVRNASINSIRDRTITVDLSGEEPWFETGTVGPTEEYDLRRALTRLSEEQREVVVMHVWGGLSFRELGEILDIPQNTAASRYRYAIALLKEYLSVPAKDNIQS
jgi:RNA polymerase sigma-70 factor (ECF subfamily)